GDGAEARLRGSVRRPRPEDGHCNRCCKYRGQRRDRNRLQPVPPFASWYLRRRKVATSRRGGGVLAEAVQVLLPAVRDPRRGEMDEEHRRRRARLRAERHRDLLWEPVALAHVARGARG